MTTYKRYRFPPDVISYAVWLYYRFNLSHRDVEDLLAERGITVSRESIRLWCPKNSLRSRGRLCIKFGALYARGLKRSYRGYGDTLYVDEVFAGVPDHTAQWQAALPVASRRPGEPAPRSALGMAEWLMSTCKPSAMGQLRNGSSSGYSDPAETSLGRS
jgi:hypothetical protein